MSLSRKRSLSVPALALGLAAVATGLWLAWPWLRPRLWPATGPAWLVVLDGHHRLDAALEIQRREHLPILLISCPSTGQPTPEQWRRASAPLLLLRQGFDTATQMVALAHWQPRRPASESQPETSLDWPAVIWLVTDPDHLPRASMAAQIAIGSAGTWIQSQPAFPPGSPAVDSVRGPLAAPPVPDRRPWSSLGLTWPVWRDALRLQLWRATGSTAAFLRPERLRSKQSACRGSKPVTSAS